jgi:hypothetical protein
MKEMAFELEWSIAGDGGLDRVDIDEVNYTSAACSATTAATTRDPSNSSTGTSPNPRGPAVA